MGKTRTRAGGDTGPVHVTHARCRGLPPPGPHLPPTALIPAAPRLPPRARRSVHEASDSGHGHSAHVRPPQLPPTGLGTDRSPHGAGAQARPALVPPRTGPGGRRQPSARPPRPPCAQTPEAEPGGQAGLLPPARGLSAPDLQLRSFAEAGGHGVSVTGRCLAYYSRSSVSDSGCHFLRMTEITLDELAQRKRG